MPRTTQRYNEYLSAYHFYPNSIEFRIVSSKALEKFKNVQSFQLNQLVNGKYYFPQDRREILLLKYDMWSRWLVEIENLFIELHETSKTIRAEDIDIILALTDKTSEKYTSIICDENKGHFENDFASIWLASHNDAYELFLNDLRQLHGTYEEVFTRIVDILCEILQYTLMEIHELNEMFNHDDSEIAFLIVSDLCIRYYKQTNECIVAKRCSTYKKHFPFKKVWFKNYTDYALPTTLIDNVESLGIEIDYKRCSFN